MRRMDIGVGLFLSRTVTGARGVASAGETVMVMAQSAGMHKAPSRSTETKYPVLLEGILITVT